METGKTTSPKTISPKSISPKEHFVRDHFAEDQFTEVTVELPNSRAWLGVGHASRSVVNSFNEDPLVSHGRSPQEDVSRRTAVDWATRQHPASRSRPVMLPLRPALLCFAALAVLGFGLTKLHAQGPAVPDRELVVATKAAPPFAMKHPDGSWSGLSIALWEKIANREHLHFRLVETQSVPDLLDGVANGTFDAGVAAVTVTAARAHSVDFTQPFYNTGLGVAVPINENPWLSIGRALLSFGFFQAVGVLLCFAMAVGFLIWLLERRKTEHFGGGAKGLGSSFWWSTIAMTQAGAVHNAPATLPGRIVAMGWMIASVIAIAVFTAGITSTLTRRGLQGAVHSFNDLRSVRVGAVVNSATTEYLGRQRLSFQTFPDIQSGLSALEAGKIDAFVHDKPLLTWMVRNDFSSAIRVVDTSFGSESYAIVLPKNSALRPMLDLAVLDQVESDWWQQTLFETLGTARSP